MPRTPTQPRAAALALAIAAAAALPQQAAAGAFQLNERSAKAQGASFAGSVSAASDVTFIGFNPAALGRVQGFEAGGNASVVQPIADGTIVNGPAAGARVDADRARGLIAGAVGYRVNDWLAVGFATNSPFGLVSSYPNGSPFSGDATTSELMTVVFSPMVAVTPVRGLTIGAALNVAHADVRLASGITNLDGDDMGYGYSIGLLWEPVAGTRIGAAWHSGYDLEVTGQQQPVAAPLPQVPLVAQASLPGFAQLGITQQVTDDLTVMAEFRWINWSVFDAITVQSPTLAGTPFANITDVQGYDDAIFAALGVEYQVDERITLRGGVAYDDTPTNDRFRTLRVPDENRLWLSVGGSLAVNDHMTLDIAYSYLHGLAKPEVTLRNGPLAGSLVEFDGGAHILSVGGSIRF